MEKKRGRRERESSKCGEEEGEEGNGRGGRKWKGRKEMEEEEGNGRAGREESEPLLEGGEVAPSRGVRAERCGNSLSRLEHDDDGRRGGARREHSQDERQTVMHRVVPHRAQALIPDMHLSSLPANPSPGSRSSLPACKLSPSPSEQQQTINQSQNHDQYNRNIIFLTEPCLSQFQTLAALQRSTEPH